IPAFSAPRGTRGALMGLPLLYRLQRGRVVFLTLRHGRRSYAVMLYSIVNVRMRVYFSRNFMIRQGMVNRQAIGYTIDSILVGGRTKLIFPFFTIVSGWVNIF